MFDMSKMLGRSNNNDIDEEPERKIQRIKISSGYIVIIAPGLGEAKGLFSWRLYSCEPRVKEKTPPKGLFAKVTRHLWGYGYTFSRTDAVIAARRLLREMDEQEWTP